MELEVAIKIGSGVRKINSRVIEDEVLVKKSKEEIKYIIERELVSGLKGLLIETFHDKFKEDKGYLQFLSNKQVTALKLKIDKLFKLHFPEYLGAIYYDSQDNYFKVASLTYADSSDHPYEFIDYGEVVGLTNTISLTSEGWIFQNQGMDIYEDFLRRPDRYPDTKIMLKFINEINKKFRVQFKFELIEIQKFKTESTPIIV